MSNFDELHKRMQKKYGSATTETKKIKSDPKEEFQTLHQQLTARYADAPRVRWQGQPAPDKPSVYVGQHTGSAVQSATPFSPTKSKTEYNVEIKTGKDELSRLEELLGKKQDLGTFLRNTYTMTPAAAAAQEAATKDGWAKEYGYGSWSEAQNRYEILQRDVEQLEREQKFGYLSEDADYDYYRSLGASVENPEMEEAEKWIGGKEIGNIVTYSRANAEAIAVGEVNNSRMQGRSIYTYMLDEEVSNYNYLLAREGAEAAQEYLDFLEPALQERQAEQWTESLQEIENPVGKVVAQGAFGVAAGVDRALGGMKQIVNKEALPQNATQHTSENLQEDMGTVGRVFYSAAENIGHMVPSILVSALFGGAGAPTAIAQTAGSLAMGAGVGGNAYAEAIADGYSDTQARNYGLLVGASEALLQKAIGGISALGGMSETKLMSKIATFDNALLRGASRFGVNLAGEITEEELQNFLEPAIRSVLFGEEYDAPTVDELIETALVTALTVGALEGPTTIAQTATEEQTKNSAYREALPELVAESGELSGETELGTRIQEQMDAGQKVATRDINRLVAQNEAAIAEQTATQAEAMLTERGETGNVAEVAQVVGKMATGQRLTRQEMQIFRESQNAADVLNEINEAEATAETSAQETAETAQEAQIPTPVEVEGESQKLAPVAEIGQESPSVPAPAAEVVEPTETDVKAVQGATLYEDEVREIEAHSKQYGEQAEDYIRSFDAGQNVAEYDAAWRAGYELGMSQVPQAQAMESSDLAYLTPGQRVDAYEAGLKAAGVMATRQEARVAAMGNRAVTGTRKLGTVRAYPGLTLGDLQSQFNDSQKKAYKILSEIAKVTGIDIVLYRTEANADGDFEGAQGKYIRSEPGRIYLDVNAGLSNVSEVGDMANYTMLATFTHEFVHFCENWNPVRYNELRKVVFETMAERGVNVEDRIDQMIRDSGGELSREGASREAVAESLVEILPDANFVEQLANEHKTLFQKLLERMKAFLQEIKDYFARMRKSSDPTVAALKEEVDGMTRYVDHIVKLFDNVAVEAVNRMQESEVVEGVEDATEQKQRRPVPADRDAEYMDAVNRGDMETAQKMVDEVAKQAGYGGPFYHGAKKGGGFTKFRDWSYFTQNKKYAERYTDRNKPESMYTVYVQMNNPFDTRKAKAKREFQNIREEYGLSAIQASGLPDWTDGYDISEYIDENDLGYDGILLDEGGDMVEGKPVSRGISYVVRKSNQVKSADPVTYDDDGNVIPLSERFNEDNPDIRYQRRNTNRLSDFEVLEAAAAGLEGLALTEEEQNSLGIMRQKLARLSPITEQIGEHERLASELAESNPEEAQKERNRASVLKRKRTAELNAILAGANGPIMRRVLQKARSIVEKQEVTEYREARKESELAKRYKARIEKDVNEMITWGLKPDTKNALKHIPEGIKGPVMDFLETIDFSSKRKLAGGAETQKDLRLAAKLQAIKSALDGGSQSVISEDYKNIVLSEAFFGRLESLISEVSNLTSQARSMDAVINEMSAKGLEDLSDLIKNLKSLITKFNTFHKNAMFAHVYEAGEETTQTLREMKPMGGANPVGGYLDWSLARPAYVWERFGKGGESIWHELQKAQADQAFHIDEVEKWANKTYSAAEVKAWEKDVRKIELSDGTTVEMTVAQIMAVYKLRERRQALGHLLGEGMRIPKTAGIKQADEGHFLTMEDLDTIISELNDRQKAVADKLQKYMQDKGSEWGNQVTMVRFGEKLFGEPNYYPIHVDRTGLSQTLDEPLEAQSLYALLNMGFTKQTKEDAKNRIVIYSIFDEFSTHMASMATYNAFALPVVDAIKWFNYSEGTGQGVRSQLARVYGREKGFGTNEGKSLAEAWILNQIKAINGTNRTQMSVPERLIGKATSTYNRAQIAANLSVVIQQPFSVLRATNVISPVSLAAGEIKKWGQVKSVWTEMDKHSGIALWKKLGFYDVNITRGLSELIKHDKKVTDKIADGAMKLAELMDRWAWATMWQACKREVEAKQKIKPGAEGYWDAVNALFDEVIYKTQVVDSPLAKAEFMTSKSVATRPFTAFMSEPLTAYNNAADAFYKFRMTAAKDGKGKAWNKHKGAILRGIAVYASSALVQAMVTALRDAWRDDDEYATFGEKWEENFRANFWEELNPFSKLPWVSDIVNSVLLVLKENEIIKADVYESSTAAQSLIDLANKLLRQHTKDTKYTDYGKVYNWLKALSGATGIPFANLTREVISIWNNTVGGLYPDKKIKTYDPGDKQSIREALESGYLTEEEAAEALRKAKVTDSNGDPISYEGTAAYWAYKANHPDEDVESSWFEAYHDKGAKKAGIKQDTYLSYRKKVKGMDSKKDILPIINGMNITKAQKDALYREHTTWSEDALSEAPWH